MPRKGRVLQNCCPVIVLGLLLVASEQMIPSFCTVSGFVPLWHNRERVGRWHVLLDERIPRPNERGPPQGGDMAYIEENIQRQADVYRKIRNVGGVESVHDVYARDPEQSNFWFVGKVSRCTGTVTLNQAIARQLNLMEEHAVRLRPVELGRSLGVLQFWVAPGDSEAECARNDPSVLLTCMQRHVEGTEDVHIDEVGFDCQVVTNQGMGFHLERRDDGTVPPELMLPSSTGEFE